MYACPLTFWFDIEGGGFDTIYNNVQIPAETGTRLSLTEDLSAKIQLYYRLQAGVDAGRHSVFVLYAPLLAESTGTPDTDIDFYGETFSSGTPLTGKYKFNSYRLTYAYALIKNPSFELYAGLSGKIRDAYISLDNGTVSSKRTDLGFVPLIHLAVQWFFAPDFSLLLRGEGLAAPQGRAEDFQLALTYSPSPKIELRLGYRLLEGGSDGGGSVYTFSMFQYLGAGVRMRL